MTTDQRIPTTERLALALEGLNDSNIDWMVKKARAGHYDDFKTMSAFPQLELVKDLVDAGHHEMAQRVVAGEFDAEEWEANEWADSPEGQEAFRLLLGE